MCVYRARVCARAGEKAAATVRGKANAEKDKCKERLKPSQIDFFASDLTEISVQIVIDKVLMYCSVDGDTKGDKSPFSLAAFNEACPPPRRHDTDGYNTCTRHAPRRYHAPTMCSCSCHVHVHVHMHLNV